MRIPPLPLLLFLVALLAGCSAGKAPDTPAGGGAESTAAIHGVVVTPAIVPVAGASVRLAPLARGTTTAADGSFAFDGVPDGAYTLDVGKAGYRNATVAVQAAAGSPLVQAVLEPDPRIGAFVDTYLYEGFINSSFNVASARSGGDGPRYDIGERAPDLIQTEMAWEATQDLGEWLDLTALPIDGSAVIESIGHAMGPSPLLLQLNSTAIQAGKLGPKVHLEMAVFAGEQPMVADHGGGLALNQPYRVFTHMFYGDLPPDGWRFTSDGDPPSPP